MINKFNKLTLIKESLEVYEMLNHYTKTIEKGLEVYEMLNHYTKTVKI